MFVFGVCTYFGFSTDLTSRSLLPASLSFCRVGACAIGKIQVHPSKYLHWHILIHWKGWLDPVCASHALQCNVLSITCIALPEHPANTQIPDSTAWSCAEHRQAKVFEIMIPQWEQKSKKGSNSKHKIHEHKLQT